jgi:hypothetical protein
LKLADSGKEGFSEDDFRQSHSAQFTGLTPETHYNFQVECRDRSGNISVTSNFEFTTLSGRDMISPPNVGYFEATGADRMVRLSWLNPDDPDFEGVVITRNTLFYPRNVFDGLVVYDGKSFALSDFNVTANQTYYYAAFSYDKVGNFSSGAIALATTPSIFGAASTSTSVYLRGLSINDFELWQGGRLLVMSSGKAFRVKAREPLKVVFPGKEAAETPKAITVSLGNDSQSFSIILKENAQGTGYEGWIITPAELENASLLIKVFDFENQEQKSISYDLVVVDGAKADNLGWQIATGLALVIVIAAAAFLLKILVRV